MSDVLTSSRLASYMVVGTVVFGALYYSFQKGKLPSYLAMPFGRIIFHPMLFLNRLKYSLRSNLLYWTPITHHLLLGCAPVTRDHCETLVSIGVTHVISMLDEYEGPMDLLHEHGIKSLWLPTIDHFEPDVQKIESAVEFIEQSITSGKKIMDDRAFLALVEKAKGASGDGGAAFDRFDADERFLHPHAQSRVLVYCKGGHGRSAAVVYAYLLKNSIAAERRRGVSNHLTLERRETIQIGLSSLRRVRKSLFKQANINTFAQNLR